MKKLFLFLLLATVATVRSQTSDWQYFVESKGAFHQAAYGNDLWLSTNAGLVKFNKTTYSYTIYDKINSPLPSNFITAMTTDANGDLWMCVDNYSSVGVFPTETFRSSLVKYDGSAWTEFNQSNSLLPDGRISELAIDTSGSKWMLYDNALVKFDNVNFTVYDTSNTPVTIPYFLSVATDINNNVWLGTYEGLFKFDGSTWTNYNTANSPLLSNYVFSVASGSNGKLWIGTANTGPGDGGLNSFDGSTWMSYNMSSSGLPENWVRNIVIDDSNHVWLTPGSFMAGITNFDGGSSWHTYNTSNSGIISNYVSNVSATGSIAWIGCYDGLSRFDGSSWTNFDFNQTGLPTNRIWDIAIDGNDVKYFPTDLGEGLVRFDNAGWTTDTAFDARMTSNLIAIDHNDHIRKGSFWDNQLKTYDGLSWQSYTLFNFPPAYNTMYSLCIDHLDNVWAGTEMKGLGKFDGVSWTVYDTSNSAIGYNTVSSIDEDSLGNLWLGNLIYFTVGAYHPVCGLRKFDGSSFTQFDTTNSAIISNEVSVVKCDHLDNVWFSTPLGLSKFDGAVFTDYSPANSPLPNSVIRCISIDLNNVVWVGTDSGMLSFDGAAWTLYNQGNSDLPLDGVSAIKVDSYNNKWIAFARVHPLGDFEGYGVTVFNENGIQGLSLSAGEQATTAETIVYPNPFSSSATLRLSGNSRSLKLLRVFDNTGRKVLERSFTGNETAIEREQLDQGMYFYSIMLNGNAETIKGKFIILN